jgi:hypothetical protein
MTGTKGWTKEETFDWDNTSTEPPPPLEDGTYRARVVAAMPELTQKGDPCIKIELQVYEALTKDGASELNPPRKMFDTLVLSKGAAFRVKQICRSAKVDPPASSRRDVVEEFCGRLVESESVALRSRRESYKGKMNARCDRYLGDDQIQASIDGTLGTDAGSGEGAGETAAAAGGRRRRR